MFLFSIVLCDENVSAWSVDMISRYVIATYGNCNQSLWYHSLRRRTHVHYFMQIRVRLILHNQFDKSCENTDLYFYCVVPSGSFAPDVAAAVALCIRVIWDFSIRHWVNVCKREASDKWEMWDTWWCQVNRRQPRRQEQSAPLISKRLSANNPNISAQGWRNYFILFCKFLQCKFYFSPT